MIHVSALGFASYLRTFFCAVPMLHWFTCKTKLYELEYLNLKRFVGKFRKKTLTAAIVLKDKQRVLNKKKSYFLPWWQIVKSKVSPVEIPLLAKYLQTSNCREKNKC